MVELQLKSPPNNLVAVTGISRSGKSMLAPIVSSLNRSENLQTDYTLEQFPVLNHLGLMSEHIAIYLMRYMVNFKIYDNQIGRNSNFRFTDWTSIWNTSDPRQYLRRLIKDEGDDYINGGILERGHEEKIKTKAQLVLDWGIDNNIRYNVSKTDYSILN